MVGIEVEESARKDEQERGIRRFYCYWNSLCGLLYTHSKWYMCVFVKSSVPFRIMQSCSSSLYRNESLIVLV